MKVKKQKRTRIECNRVFVHGPRLKEKRNGVPAKRSGHHFFLHKPDMLTLQPAKRIFSTLFPSRRKITPHSIRVGGSRRPCPNLLR